MELEVDLGGYAVITENIVDIEILKQGKLQGLMPKYTDIIECKEGVNWTSSLFLFSSDFSIVVITTEKAILGVSKMFNVPCEVIEKIFK